jgi:hypothetical protein
MLNDYGIDKYNVNFGQCNIPNMTLENAKAFIDAVNE